MHVLLVTLSRMLSFPSLSTPCYAVLYLPCLSTLTSNPSLFPYSAISIVRHYAILPQRNYIFLPVLILHSLNSFTLPFNYLLSTILHHKESNMPSFPFTTLASHNFFLLPCFSYQLSVQLSIPLVLFYTRISKLQTAVSQKGIFPPRLIPHLHR